MKMNEIFTESQDAIQLDEKLGNLAQLNAGKLINMLRQPYGSRAEGRRFSDAQIGHDSEIIDIGSVEGGLPVLRKAFLNAQKKYPDKYAVAFALYMDDKAVAFGKYDYDKLRGQTREGIFAYDLAPFKDQIESIYKAKQEAEPENWRRQRISPPTMTSYTERGTWYDDGKMSKFTGMEMSTGALADKMTRFAELAKELGVSFTGKLVFSDKAGDEKRTARRRLSREDIMFGGEDITKRLQKYKLSKKPTVNTIEEFIALVNAAKKEVDSVQFAGRTYSTEPSARSNINPRDMMAGNPFDIEYKSVDPGYWSELKVTYVFDPASRTINPVYATWYGEGHDRQTGILNAEAFVKSQLPQGIDTTDKTKVIPELLTLIKANNFTQVKNMLIGLKQAGRDWPELAVIQRSVDAELAKKK